MRSIPTRLNQAHRFWVYLGLEVLIVSLTIRHFLHGSIPDLLTGTIFAKAIQKLSFWPSIGLPLVSLLLAWQIVRVIRFWRHIIRCDHQDGECYKMALQARAELEHLEQKG